METSQGGYDCGYECCLNSHGAEWFEKQKKQKDYHKLYEDIAQSKWFKKAYVGKSLGEEFEKKEKTPTECIDFDNEFENQISRLFVSVLNGEHEYNEGLVKYAAQSLLGYAKQEQKPAEWSDDDKTRLKVITEELERFIMFRNYGTPLSVDDIEWLKNLPERFNLQLKQERSEEDKTTLECSDQFKRFVDMVHSADKDEFTEFEWSIINFALACGDKNIAMTPKGIHCYAKTILDVVKKDFPPQISGWTDEEETVLHYACEFIRHKLNDSTCRNGSIGGMDYKELYEKLKSLRPAWKPSEEQMKCLKEIRMYIGLNELRTNVSSLSGYERILTTLINDLQKLP